MDTATCCLLGICCPPEVRRRRVIEHFESKGLIGQAAEIAADATIEMIDRILAVSPHAVIEAAKKHKGDA